MCVHVPEGSRSWSYNQLWTTQNVLNYWVHVFSPLFYFIKLYLKIPCICLAGVGGRHATVHMWSSEDSMGCESLPSTLFKTESICIFHHAHQIAGLHGSKDSSVFGLFCMIGMLLLQELELCIWLPHSFCGLTLCVPCLCTSCFYPLVHLIGSGELCDKPSLWLRTSHFLSLSLSLLRWGVGMLTPSLRLWGL